MGIEITSNTNQFLSYIILLFFTYVIEKSQNLTYLKHPSLPRSKQHFLCFEECSDNLLRYRKSKRQTFFFQSEVYRLKSGITVQQHCQVYHLENYRLCQRKRQHNTPSYISLPIREQYIISYLYDQERLSSLKHFCFQWILKDVIVCSVCLLSDFSDLKYCKM